MELNPEKYRIPEKYRLSKYQADSPRFEKANLSAARYLKLQGSFGGIRI
jgi:hypothetical protein